MAQEAINLPGYTGTVLVHERPVEHGGLPVGLARHESVGIRARRFSVALLS